MTGKQELESLSHHPRVPKETKTWWNDTTTEKRKMILQGLAADKTIKANFGSRSRLLEDHDKILQGEGAITLPTRRRFVDIREEIKDVRKDLIPKDHRQTQAVDAALEACFADAAVFVADPNEAYSCSCNPIDGGAYRLDCEATCGEYCNEEGLICGNKSFRRDYNGNGVSNFLRDTFEYTRGFVGRVDISQLNCFEDDQGNIECPECIAVTNGGACNSCFMQSCSTGEKSPLLDCENIVDGGAIFDLCAEDIVVDDGLFEFLSSGEYEDCIDPTVKAKEACETFRAFYETMYDDKQYECICQENSIGSMTLGCEAKCGKVSLFSFFVFFAA